MDRVAAFQALSRPRQEALLEKLGDELERVALLELVEAKVRVEELEAEIGSSNGDVRHGAETDGAPAPPPEPDSGPPGGAGARTSSPGRRDRLSDEQAIERILAELRANGEATASTLAPAIGNLSPHRCAELLAGLERRGVLVHRPYKRGRKYRLRHPLVDPPHDGAGAGSARRGQTVPDSPDLETALDRSADVEPPRPAPGERPIMGRQPGTPEYEILRELGKGRARIPAIAAAIDRPPAEVAHHVELLKRANLVAKDKTGQIERLGA